MRLSFSHFRHADEHRRNRKDVIVRFMRSVLGTFVGNPGEIELRGRVGSPQDLLMSMTAVVLSLTVAARPGRGQQRGRGRGPIFGRL
jgi:hypothetical protein